MNSMRRPKLGATTRSRRRSHSSFPTPFIAILCSLVCCCLLFQPVAGYDRDGHEAIGMTAMSAIQGGKVLNTLKKLLKGKDAMDVAGWAHLVDDKYPWTEAFHFQKYKLDPAAFPEYESQCGNLELINNGADCEGNMCLVQILKHFYGTLVYGKDDPRTIKVKFPDGVTFTDADAVKFLINLLGDMHQPLHFMPTGDIVGPVKDKSAVTGSQIVVTVPGKGKEPGTPVKTNLYELWDRNITAWVKQAAPMFWDGGWTNIHRGPMFGVPFDAGSLYEREKAELKKGGPEAFEKFFDRWGLDSAKYACLNVYRDPVSKNIITSGFELPAADYDIWKNNMLIRMLTAGARIAIMINAIVDFKPESVKTFQAGSGVEIVDPQDQKVWDEVIPDHNLKPAKFNAGSIAFNNFCINFAIFVIELCLLLIFLRVTQPPKEQRFSEVQLAEMQSEPGKVPARRSRAD